MRRHKTKVYSGVPKSIVELRDKFSQPEIMQKYGYTLDGKSPFYAGTVVKPGFAFTVFASQYAMDFIQKNIPPGSRRYLMDGTFDSLPNDFYQLLIIGIEYRNAVSVV